MCGVIGYVGRSATPRFFFQGLKRLEYRGYDSAGIAMLGKDDIYIERAAGKLCNLEPKLDHLPESTTVGIGHTRWATHGKPTENNAHPHRSGHIVLLHNGIIENYKSLKEKLIEDGYRFESDTDTEVAAHLLHQEYVKLSEVECKVLRMQKAIQATVQKLHGAYAFAIMSKELPAILFAVKNGSPIILGRGNGENYLASGVTALIEHTRDVAFLEDGDIATLTPEKIEIQDSCGNVVQRVFKQVEWSVGAMEKNGYRHFMLKEIYEHPIAIAQTLQGRLLRGENRVDLDAYGIAEIDLIKIDRVHIIACGTSYYAALLGKYYIEKFAKIPVEVDLASEYRYKTCTASEKTLAIAVSQSGETADTLQAIKYAKSKGAKTLAIVNVPGSSIGEVCVAESQLLAGPEVGVASTKAFSAQTISMVILSLALAQERKTLSEDEIEGYIEEFIKVPSLVEKTLGTSSLIEKMASHFSAYTSMLFIGRGPEYAIALEGALKLKELSYIHAEAYAAGELKHGPIALIDENMPVICLAPRDDYFEKTMSNIQEIKARDGIVLSVGTEDDLQLEQSSNYFIPIPKCSQLLLPFLTVIPMHLFAYWIAVRKGTDIDQPRNLAKSVTVE
ncbi:MAG: glutamine--fructose-6-phosphate transaminase (isomerizing) [Chlamydiales bacterium]|nr:glutamine--fructose-6-phosphate transaminase (isomerizing) [Chlamydiales bacterium]